ncbi:MAG: helix-turn-helix transcriptional regulator [Sedimenticola sp.]
MIRYRLKERLADREFTEGRRITLDEISRETGISRPTLTRITNQRGYSTSTEILEKLCVYFGCQVCDLVEYVADKDDKEV